MRSSQLRWWPCYNPAVFRRLTILLVTAICLLVSLRPARALAMELRLDVSASSSSLIALGMNGIELLALPVNKDGSQLAQELARFLSTALRNEGGTPIFTASGSNLMIGVRGQPGFALPLSLVANPAGENGSIEDVLQGRWEKALAAAQLRAEPQMLTIPVGEWRTARLVSVSDAPIELMNPFPKLVKSRIDGCRIEVAGICEGEGYLLARQGEQTLSIPFSVRLLAAYLPGRLSLQVCGSGYELSEIARLSQIQLAALSALPPDVSLRVRFDPDGSSARHATLEVSASAPGRLNVNRRIPVEFEYAQFLPPHPDTVLFSNAPERITEPGRLFAATLLGGDRERLVYHHQNGLRVPVRLRVQLRNLSPESQRVFFRGGASAPDDSTLAAGLASVREYLRQLVREQGCVLVLAPGARASLWESEMAHLESASGNLDLIMMSRGPIAVLVDALPIDAESAVGQTDFEVPEAPPRFRPAVSFRRFDFDLDGHWLFVRLGQGEMKNLRTGVALVGDYGLLTETEVLLGNSKARERYAELSFDATAGDARGVFLIDGELVVTPRVRPGRPVVLSRFLVPPHGFRCVRILTMPLNGSHYPASLVFSSRK